MIELVKAVTNLITAASLLLVVLLIWHRGLAVAGAMRGLAKALLLIVLTRDSARLHGALRLLEAVKLDKTKLSQRGASETSTPDGG